MDRKSDRKTQAQTGGRKILRSLKKLNFSSVIAAGCVWQRSSRQSAGSLSLT